MQHLFYDVFSEVSLISNHVTEGACLPCVADNKMQVKNCLGIYEAQSLPYLHHQWCVSHFHG